MDDADIFERLESAGLYTAEMAAAYLSLSATTFRDYRCRGYAPKGHLVCGKSLLFAREELNRYRDGCRNFE